MADIAYVSEVDLERVAGPLRVAHLPGESNPVYFSTHGPVAKHYGVDPANLKETHATTLDYIVAAAAGWLLGTFAGALAARKIEVDNGKVQAHARGEVEDEGGTLIIRRIHVHLKLAAPESARETVERVHGMYAQKCPIYRSLIAAIQITTSYELMAAWSPLIEECVAALGKCQKQLPHQRPTANQNDRRRSAYTLAQE